MAKKKGPRTNPEAATWAAMDARMNAMVAVAMADLRAVLARFRWSIS